MLRKVESENENFQVTDYIFTRGFLKQEAILQNNFSL